MKTIIASLILILTSPAWAQPDIIVRPDPVGISATRVLTNATFTEIENCLILDGQDPLDLTTHFDCVLTGAGQITSHTITVIQGAGSVTVRAVTVHTDQSGTRIPSNASINSKTVLDVPPPPEILSGHPPLQDRVA